MDWQTLKQAAQVTLNENGVPVVQIPLPLWEDLLLSMEAAPMQHERIKALLADWDAHPDDTSDEWWDEFDRFLAEL
jgi:hypothetical protein